ncbi:hypothetical protein C2G38_2048073 [Gigaspora rosea]|uniref:Uncharacterized protein n=1 Tax=Gigaspora rosea TaxID=44941 RepID=A0A397U5G3_9GLOM|nr:hypothetical protein C2G38_2048073 [Gigaspora rosea]
MKEQIKKLYRENTSKLKYIADPIYLSFYILPKSDKLTRSFPRLWQDRSFFEYIDARNFIIQNSEIFRLKRYYNSLNATLKNLKELVKEKSYQVNYNQHMKKVEKKSRNENRKLEKKSEMKSSNKKELKRCQKRKVEKKRSKENSKRKGEKKSRKKRNGMASFVKFLIGSFSGVPALPGKFLGYKTNGRFIMRFLYMALVSEISFRVGPALHEIDFFSRFTDTRK